jgi:hypothetical protein
MQLIRRHCFETNSSSCHSLTVVSPAASYQTILPTLPLVPEIEIQLSSYEFGWGRETYRDPLSKLAYLLICLRDHAPDDKEAAERVRKVVKEHTFCDIRILEGNNRWSDGYIDHESIDLPYSDGILQNEQMIKDFIFGSGSYIETDNDNH